MWQYTYTDSLCHYGVLGMKWGVRRTPDQLKYNSNSIRSSINRKSGTVKTLKGITVTAISEHALDRINTKLDRRVSAKDIINALTKPLRVDTIKIDSLGRPSQRYIGDKATVNINPETGIIPTVWITGTKEKTSILRRRIEYVHKKTD